MATLGRSLSFYARYPREMEALFVEDEEEEEKKQCLLAAIPAKDRAQLQTDADAVGKAAGEQATKFLIDCANRIIAHFSAICNARIKNRPGNISDYWQVNILLWPKHRRRPSGDGNLEAKLWICADQAPICLFPYMWAKGGRKGEDSIINILGPKRVLKNGRSREMGPYWESGAVVLDRIMIEPPATPLADIDASPLQESCVAAFARITRRDIKALLQRFE